MGATVAAAAAEIQEEAQGGRNSWRPSPNVLRHIKRDGPRCMEREGGINSAEIMMNVRIMDGGRNGQMDGR